MKTDRLIGILSVLMQKDRITANELAEKFEVSKRTILRDIEAISMAGIPIITAQGQGGGISVMDGFRLDRTILSEDDMRSLISALSGLDSVSNTGKYRHLMEKLSADSSDNILTGDRNIIIDLSSWDKSVVADKISLIKNAVEDKKKISFTYYSPSGETHREIEPYHLIFQWSGWYVWGYCCLRNDWRMFKLTRLAELICTGEKCPEREVPSYSCDTLRHTRGEIKALVRFDKSVKWRIIDEYGHGCGEYDKEGNILLSFTWSDVPSLFQYLLTFGDKAEIIEPLEYRRKFSELLKKISDKYQT